MLGMLGIDSYNFDTSDTISGAKKLRWVTVVHVLAIFVEKYIILKCDIFSGELLSLPGSKL
jgi:hypothetical protein